MPCISLLSCQVWVPLAVPLASRCKSMNEYIILAYKSLVYRQAKFESHNLNIVRGTTVNLKVIQLPSLRHSCDLDQKWRSLDWQRLLLFCRTIFTAHLMGIAWTVSEILIIFMMQICLTLNEVKVILMNTRCVLVIEAAMSNLLAIASLVSEIWQATHTHTHTTLHDRYTHACTSSPMVWEATFLFKWQSQSQWWEAVTVLDLFF